MSTQAISTTEQPMPNSPTPIPVPADFPVQWEDPGDAQLLWMQQRMHFPEPITPLDEWFLRGEFEGVTRAARVYDLPFCGKGRRINTYAYASLISTPPSDTEGDHQNQDGQENLAAIMGNLMEVWNGKWLPEIQEILAKWAAFDLPTASMSQLVEHLNEVIQARERLWDIHFQVWIPAYTAISLFEELYRDLFGGENIFEAYRLLQGFNNKTLETTHALWQLSRTALEKPEVYRVLRQQSTAGVLAALEQSEEGRAFLLELHAYLNEYGQRSDKWVFSYPSWIEDPTPVIKSIQEYITQPDRDLQTDLLMLATKREDALVEVRQRLVDYPQPLVEHFEFLLKAAQEGCVLTEDHGFWIDFRGWYPIRCLFLEFGRRFAEAGVLDRAEDIFYLTLEEVRTTALDSSRSDHRALVVGRRAEEVYFRSIRPPDALGTLPAGSPPDQPVLRAIGKFFGPPPPQQSEPAVVQGTGGSPGIVRGPARLIKNLGEATKLQQGDILVAVTTAPPWTPLFATAAAVVTDTGGILSHCAVVAREYAIPAVVGTGNATAVLHDGQMLEVDGTAGSIRILDTASEGSRETA